MSKEDVLLFGCYGMRGTGKSYYEKLKEKDKEIERLNKELHFWQTIADKRDNERKEANNIIKEVREILNYKREISIMQLIDRGYCDYEELLYQVYEEIRKILDKVEENKNGSNNI